jgi:PIN domain nuclease of toxin-antitoxin system
MRLLLDTHTLLWWFDGDAKLSRKVRTLISDKNNEVLVSAVSAWEIATKSRLGKLPKAGKIAPILPRAVAEQGFIVLPILITHAHRAGWLDSAHRDPFDRMLAAQAEIENLAFATTDAFFGSVGVATIW